VRMTSVRGVLLGFTLCEDSEGRGRWPLMMYTQRLGAAYKKTIPHGGVRTVEALSIGSKPHIPGRHAPFEHIESARNLAEDLSRLLPRVQPQHLALVMPHQLVPVLVVPLQPPTHLQVREEPAD
jgi:hypothetical protein